MKHTTARNHLTVGDILRAMELLASFYVDEYREPDRYQALLVELAKVVEKYGPESSAPS